MMACFLGAEMSSRRAELQRHAALYAEHPDPVTRQIVNFAQRPLAVQREEESSNAEEEPQDLFLGPWSGPSQRQKKEATRRQIEQAWGIWIWLVAELVPNGEFLSITCNCTDSMHHKCLVSTAWYSWCPCKLRAIMCRWSDVREELE